MSVLALTGTQTVTSRSNISQGWKEGIYGVVQGAREGEGERARERKRVKITAESQKTKQKGGAYRTDVIYKRCMTPPHYINHYSD